MAVLLVMKFKGVTLDQYDKVRELTNFEGDQPKGGIFHVCAGTADGMRIVDVWESHADFDAFMAGRLAAAMQQAGIEDAPEVEASEVHNIYQPV